MTYLLGHIYNDYIEETKSSVEESVFKSICSEFNIAIIDYILEGKEFNMGNHLSSLSIRQIERNNNKPTVPGLYLTGNLPLSEVLQYELSKAGGGGRTFVRHIKSYLYRYIYRSDLIPFEHVLVFDEAQRAFSKEKVSDTHKNWNYNMIASEPELFIRICDRMPDWGVMMGLIGGGQEIHLGEEEGLIQWKNAISGSDF